MHKGTNSSMGSNINIQPITHKMNEPNTILTQHNTNTDNNKQHTSYTSTSGRVRALLWLYMYVAMLGCPPPCACNNVLLTLTTTDATVGAMANLTAVVDRSTSINGTSITPANINTTKYQIIISFDSSYRIIDGTTTLAGITNYTLYPANSTILLYYDTALYPKNLVTISVLNLRNPYISANYLSTYLTINNEFGTNFDNTYTTLMYNFAPLALPDVVWSFTPPNVSTIANMSISIRSTLLSPSDGMYVEISFRKYWTRSLSNTTSTTIFSSTSSCVPLCTFNMQTSATVLSFTNTSLALAYSASTKTLTLGMSDMRTPPTLELADQVQIVIRESARNTIVQRIDNLYVGALAANSFDYITPTTTNTIAEPLTLTISLFSRNIFGPNDTLIIVLGAGSQLLSTGPQNIYLQSALVSSYQKQAQDLNTIVLSSFSFYSTNYARLSATLTINKIAAAASTKPRWGNTIQLRRNGHLYNMGAFDYSVVSAQIPNITITIDNNYANSNTSGFIKVTLSNSVTRGDKVFINIPQGITMYNCQPQCVGCACSLILPTVNTPYSQLGVSLDSLPIPSLAWLTIAISHRNPISQGLPISVCTVDAQNYTKQCGNATYPDIVQASLSSDTLWVSVTSGVVYGIANFTFNYNFTTYDLQNGYIITIVPPTLTLVSPTNPLCRINGQPQCRIQTNSSGTYINTTVWSTTKIYTVVLSNVRNPTSTTPLSISAKIAYTTGEVYYSVVSDYYRATQPYQLYVNTHFTINRTSCINHAADTISVSFINVPISLATSFQGVTYLVYNITNTKGNTSVQQLLDLNGNIATLQYSHRNWYSYEPISYTFTLLTADRLYQIWAFTISVQNCLPAPLPILAYLFTGLPQDTGTLMLSYTNEHTTYITPNSSAYTLRLTFPQDYPLSLHPTLNTNQYTLTTVAPRVFVIQLLMNQQPVIVQLQNISNVVNVNNNYTNAPIKVDIFDSNYLIAQNDSYVAYRLADVTVCKYPCKVCTGGNGVDTGSCLECYSSAITDNYLLTAINTNTTSTGRCVAVTGCPSSTYPNATLKLCKPCPLSCSTCVNQTYCSQCANYYYMFTHTCVTDCPELYYPSTLNQTCVGCVQPCLTCVYPDKCKSCISGYYLYAGACVTVCPSAYIPLLTNTNTSTNASIWVCYGCQSPCLQCTQSLTTCTSCVTGFYLTNTSTCISQCPSPQIGYLGTCASCTSNCHRCVDSPSKCYACDEQYKLYNGTCILDCPIGHYVSSVNGSSVCIKCNLQCALCGSASYCTACASGYVLYANYCYQACPAGMYIYNTTNGTSTHQQCRTCAQSTCLSCPSSASICTGCMGGSYLYMQTCITQCPSSTYAIGTTCDSCSTGCLSCVDPSQCLNCSTQYALYMGACVVSCPADMVQLQNVCRFCSEYLVNCMSCSTLGCTACANGYSLLASSASANSSSNSTMGLTTCVLQCPAGTIRQSISNISRCTPCKLGCSSCAISTSNCTSCSPSYYYYNYTCLSACPDPMISVNYICKSCAPPCQTCSNNDTSHCQSCINDLYLLVANASSTCVTLCPSDYYEESSGNRCVACGVECSGCMPGGCLACASGYFMILKHTSGDNMTLYDCVTACPSHLQFVVPTNLCSACAYRCLQCQPSTNYTCLQCQTGYVRYSQFCVLTCPSPLVVSNGQCVQPSNNTTPNDTAPNTTNITNTTTSASVTAPVPFTIVSGVMVALVGVSKVQYSWSSIAMGVLGCTSVLVPICDIVYLATIWPTYVIQPTQVQATPVGATAQQMTSTATQSYAYVRIAMYLLISALVIIYLSNVLHSIFGCATFRKDPLFETYSSKHAIVNKLIFGVALITEHLGFAIYFSRLFNLSWFRASLKDLHCLACLNYFWGIALVGNILGLIAGIIMAAKDSTLLLPAIDLIVVNCLVLIAGLMLFKKSKGSGWMHEDYVQQPGYQVSEDDLSTKKVVMLNNEGDSDANIGAIDIDTMSEINGKIRKSLIAEDKQKNQHVQNLQSQIENINADNIDNQKIDNQKQKDLLYFQQNNKNEQLQKATDANKRDEDSNNQSESTDPLKIQPSVNMLFTAEEMRPNSDSHVVMKQKGDHEKDIHDQSMGWSSLQKEEKHNGVLPNQSKINKSGIDKDKAIPPRNIFDSEDNDMSNDEEHKQGEVDQFFVDEGQSLQAASPGKEKTKSKEGINSYASSKSLKATPRNKKQEGSQQNTASHNLAAAGISKNRKSSKFNKPGGGRSSQQFSSISNKNADKELSKSSIHKRSFSNIVEGEEQNRRSSSKQQNRRNSPTKEDKLVKRSGSRASHRLSNTSQFMGVIQQQNEEQGKNIVENKSVAKIVRGQERFLSHVLAQDSKLQNMPEIQDQSYIQNKSHINSKNSFINIHKSPSRKESISGQKNQVTNKSPIKSKYHLCEVQKLLSEQNVKKSSEKKKNGLSPNKNSQSSQNTSKLYNMNKNDNATEVNKQENQHNQIKNKRQKQYTFAELSASPKKQQLLEEEIVEENSQISKTKQEAGLDPNAVKYRLSNIGSRAKKIQGANTIFVESDEQADNGKSGQISKMNRTGNYRGNRLKQYNTIEGSTLNFPISAGNLTRADKLKAIQHINELRKSKIVEQQKDTTKHHSLNKKHLKSFRSRNVSADKLKLSTIEYKADEDDGGFVKINTKALMKEIERKEKIRSQKESLKNIYLKR